MPHERHRLVAVSARASFLADARRNSGTVSEVVAEVRRILLDAEGYLADAARVEGATEEFHLHRAIAWASIAAGRRYIERGTGAGPEPLAELIAGWVARRAGREAAAESLRVAVAAAEGTPGDAELEKDLVTFVCDYFDGSMSNRRFGHLLNNPTEPIRTASNRSAGG